MSTLNSPCQIREVRLGALPPKARYPPSAEAGERAGRTAYMGTALGSEDVGSRAYRIGGVTRPLLIRKVKPSYIERARNRKLQGAVMLAIEFWEDSKPHNLRVLSGQGRGTAPTDVQITARLSNSKERPHAASCRFRRNVNTCSDRI